MDNIITIQAITLANMKHAEHVQFHSNIRNLITTTSPDKIGLSASVFNPYRDAILAEQDIVNRAQASTFTAEMEEADKLRCRIFRLIRYKMQAVNYEDETSDVGKMKSLVQKSFLTLYKSSDCDRPAQEKTAILAGFVLDCREQLNDEQIEALRIDSDLDDLESANIKFGRFYQDRISERSSDPVYSDALRRATDQAYKLLSITLVAIANDPTPTNVSKATEAYALVGKMNQIIKEAKDRLNQRLGGGKGNGNGDTPGNDEENNATDPGGLNNSVSDGSGSGSNDTNSTGSNPSTGGNEIVIENSGNSYE